MNELIGSSSRGEGEDIYMQMYGVLGGVQIWTVKMSSFEVRVMDIRSVARLSKFAL